MTNLPTISIVTPTLNQAYYLAEALDSVRIQDYSPLEHLVIDGGSSDATLDILRRRSNSMQWHYLRWRSERDRGQSSALNKGFLAAHGDVIGWLNSDDRYRDGCLRCVARTFADNPEVDIVYGDSTWIDASGHVFRIRREIPFRPFILLYHRVLCIPTASMFFRRRVIEAGHLLDDSLHYAMDFDFFVRLALSGYKFMHISKLFADFRVHPTSKSCTGRTVQLEEHNRVVQQHSPLLRQMSSPLLRHAALRTLRNGAALLRYSEKAVRGYYFDHFRVDTINRAA